MPYEVSGHTMAYYEAQIGHGAQGAAGKTKLLEINLEKWSFQDTLTKVNNNGATNISRLNSAGAAHLIKSIVEKSLDDDKAEDIVTIDLKGKADFADYMIVASGRSGRHIASTADHLVERLRDNGFKDIHIEGKTSADWVLVDCIDVIVHLFRPEFRAFYNLERMWSVPRTDSAMTRD